MTAQWIVRQEPFSGRFVVCKVRPHPRLPNTVEVVGSNKFDVHDDICALISAHGGTPPASTLDKETG